MSLRVQFEAKITIRESPNPAAPALSTLTPLLFDQFNYAISLNDSSTPRVYKHTEFELVLGDGTIGYAEINLTDLSSNEPGTDSVDFTGFKLQMMLLQNTGDADIVVHSGNINPYGIGHGSVRFETTLPAGAVQCFYWNDGNLVVSSTRKMFQILGDPDGSLRVVLVAG